MDTTQWPRGIGIGLSKPMEGSSAITERKARPQEEQALKCPRCNSINTKFCYYNNYNLSQPRYFCKTCRRYWTEGGSLRNVPVGGGSRKNNRSSASASSKKPLDLTTPPNFSLSSSCSQKLKIQGGHDLNLAYQANSTSSSDYNNIKDLTLPFSSSSSSSSTSSHLSAMELLASKGFGSFVPVSGSETNTIYPSGSPPQEFRPRLGFSIDGYGRLKGVEETSGARLFFPFEELKKPPSTAEFEQNRGEGGDQSVGYWSGMLLGRGGSS
ncbi:hypothetical protein U1Q18_004791 [Sarracenia purpurea var. burkii]